MKVKLLKKIRKKYSIFYYPHGVEGCDGVYYINKYVIHSKYELIPLGYHRDYNTLEEAKEGLLRLLRHKYKKYARKNNIIRKRIKVWYK